MTNKRQRRRDFFHDGTRARKKTVRKEKITRDWRDENPIGYAEIDNKTALDLRFVANLCSRGGKKWD